MNPPEVVCQHDIPGKELWDIFVGGVIIVVDVEAGVITVLADEAKAVLGTTIIDGWKV